MESCIFFGRLEFKCKGHRAHSAVKTFLNCLSRMRLVLVRLCSDRNFQMVQLIYRTI